MAKVFQRVVTIMLENTMRASALSNPYLSNLRKKGVFLTNAQGVTHPSQPNYMCMVSGDTIGIVDDENHYVKGFYGHENQAGHSLPNITDLMEAHNLSWKAYAENLTDAYKEELQQHWKDTLEVTTKNQAIKAENKAAEEAYEVERAIEPSTPAPTPKPLLPLPAWPAEEFPFTRRHIPFLSFPSIVANPDRLAKVVNAKEFLCDRRSDENYLSNLPHYSFYTPNLINDGHSLPNGGYTDKKYYNEAGEDTAQIDQIATFLEKLLGNDPLSLFPPETLIVITFDEAYPYQNDYGIYTLLLGDFLEPGTVNTEPVNHFNLLATIEENFGVGNMKRNDAIAKPYWFIRQS